MNLNKGINRLAWRFSNGRSFKPDDLDIEAINSIIDWINNQKEKSIKENKLFAKLFIYFYSQKVTDYKTTVLDDLPQKELSRLLSTPLDLFILSFKKRLDMNFTDAYYRDEIGIELDFLKKKKNNIKPTKEQILESLKSKYDLLFIEEKLKDMVSEAINRFSKHD